MVLSDVIEIVLGPVLRRLTGLVGGSSGGCVRCMIT